MHEIIRDKFMREMHLRKPRFTYSASRPFTENNDKKIKRIKKIKKSLESLSRYIYQNELNKSCFQHNMAHGDFKDLPLKSSGC